MAPITRSKTALPRCDACHLNLVQIDLRQKYWTALLWSVKQNKWLITIITEHIIKYREKNIEVNEDKIDRDSKNKRVWLNKTFHVQFDTANADPVFIWRTLHY